MYNCRRPKHIGNEYISAILIKICPNWEYLMDFVRGRFYMNTNILFSEMEKESLLTNAQFDRLEGTDTILNSTEDIELVMDFSEEKPRILQGIRGSFEYTGAPIINAELGTDKPRNIYCLYSIWHGYKNNVITKVDERILNGLGEYFAIILNKEEFLNRVKKAVDKIPYKLKSDIQYGFVNYIDTKHEPYIELGPFRKDKKFIYQNEFRIALELDRKPEPLKYFEVGDLSDIVLVGKTKYLLDIKFEDNTIKIGNSQIPVKFKNI